ncbi:MAG: SRPBCC domain-containing protein [Chloroflexi bacterium]|nr:SRPBCC domain-containing protein [Chloroflexota bacterium]MBV9598635.1 SRPBCC domain-containing protein [Chloroflexota bacterium]
MTTSMTSETTFSQTSELEFVMTRVFDAPRDLVFAACTEPRHMAQWWGPRGYVLTVAEMDVRAGGTYRFVQRAPDGNTYAFHGTFFEVEPPEHLRMSQIFDPHPTSELLVSLAFEDLGDGRTRMVDTMRFDSIESRDGSLSAGMERGARESYERLAEHLETMQRGMLFERVFDAPRELVFDMWTTPEHVALWWGPDGFTNTIEAMDVRPGGEWRFIMHGPDGVDYPNHIVFREVVRPERLVYDHGSQADDEASFRGVVTFAQEDPTRTRLTMRTLFPTAAVREMVEREYHAEEGGNQTLDRLGAYLAPLAR